MTKDRLQEFQEDVAKHNDGESISMVNHFAVVDMEGPFMNDFFDQVNVLRNNIDKLTVLVDDVNHLQHAMLVSCTTNEAKEKLEEKMNEIKQLGNCVRTALKQMKQNEEIKSKTNGKNVYQRITDSHIDAITKCFCIIMDKYYQSIITYREKCKARVGRQFQLIGIEKNDHEIEEILQNGRLSMFPEIIIETQEAKQTLNLVELRHRDLVELEKSIREVHDMFFDLAYLVQSQDDRVSYIKDNIFGTEEATKKHDKFIHAKKVSYCFGIKWSKKRFISSLILRLFSSCV